MILEISAALLDHFRWHGSEGVGFDYEPTVDPFTAVFDSDEVIHAGVFLRKPNNLLAAAGGMSNSALDVHLDSHRIRLSTSDQMVGRAGFEPARLSDGSYSPAQSTTLPPTHNQVRRNLELRIGFEPTRAYALGFAVPPLQPLGHLNIFYGYFRPIHQRDRPASLLSFPAQQPTMPHEAFDP